MSKKIFVDAFFTQFHGFLGELTRVFPEDEDFPAYDSGLKLMESMNRGLVLSEFTKHVILFETIIRAKNSDFFLKHNFSEFDPDNTMDPIIKKLKGYWESMSDANKEAIWNYIILLVDISKRCV
jgi:hypothetical protein